MIVAFDNTFLSLVFHPDSKPTPDPKTGRPVEHCKVRVEALIDGHSKRSDTVLIPTPCYAELLTAVPDMERAIGDIERSTAFRVEPFDARAAIDLALVSREALAAGDKKSGVSAGWQEVKFDRQIAAIAKVHGAEVFYTDDPNQASYARHIGLKVLHTWNLDLPPEFAQAKLWEDGDNGES